MTDIFYDKNKFNHSLFFTMCNNMREGAIIIEAASKKFIYCNNAFLKLFDLDSINDLDITQFRKFRKEMLTETLIAEREKTLLDKGYFNELVEYTSLKGHSFFGEVTIQYYVSKEKAYYLFVVNPVDRAFFELASLGILMVNKRGEIATANPFILNEFGYTKNELIGKKIEQLIPPRFHHKHIEHRNKFMQAPNDHIVGAGRDLIALKKDGTEFPVELSLGHYPSDGDKYVIAFVNNISLRKNSELALKKLNNELESIVEERTAVLQKTLTQLETSKAELQKVVAFQKALLDKAGAMIISIDVNGIIQTFNPEAEKELGYKADELIGKHTPLIYTDAQLLHQRIKNISPDWKTDVPLSNELFQLNKTHAILIEEDEWIFVRKDGTKFPSKVNITAMRNEDDGIIGYVAVAFDITRIKKFEEDLQQALEKEKELSELKSRFVSMASHEFRTPLSTVLSSSYLIEKYTSTADQPKREKHLQRIVSSVNMLSDILNDFLSVGKIEEGKMQVRYSQFNIKDLIITVVGDMKSSLKKKQKIWYHHEGCQVITLDPSLLKHIVMNLISNASKFSAEGKPIDIKTVVQNDQFIFLIKDQGMGISKEDQQHLMERFFRGTNAANIQGTGLGLHIVSKYSELMNGTVQCNSELEKGTAFIITFNF